MPKAWFPVKALLGHRSARSRSRGNNGYEYLVQWDGINPKTGREWEHTWEPSAYISPAIRGGYHIDLLRLKQHQDEGIKEDENERQQDRQIRQLSQGRDKPSSPDAPPLKQSSELYTSSAFELCTLPAVPAGPSRSSENLEGRSTPNTQAFSERDGLTFDPILGPREQIFPSLSPTEVGPPAHSNMAPSQSRPKRPARTKLPTLYRTQASLMNQHMRSASAGRESPAVDENQTKKRRLGMLNLRLTPPPAPGEDNETPLARNGERDARIGL